MAAAMAARFGAVVDLVPFLSWGKAQPRSGFGGGAKRFLNAFFLFPTMFIYMKGPPGTYKYMMQRMMAW